MRRSKQLAAMARAAEKYAGQSGQSLSKLSELQISDGYQDTRLR